MIEFALLTVAGFVIGTFGTLVGAGGGFLLVPLLLLLYPGEPPETVTAISLLVVCANAASGSVAYARQRRIDWLSGALFAAATLPGAVGGALLVQHVPRRAFDLLFAVVLGLIGASLLWPRHAQAIRAPVTGRWVLHRELQDATGVRYFYSYRAAQGVVISIVVGFVSSLLGIGGGIVHVPMMVVLLHFPVHVATATSHFVLALMALEATIVHVATGTLAWNRALAQGASLGVGALGGAQLGARLAHRVPATAILRALGGALLLVAVRLALIARG